MMTKQQRPEAGIQLWSSIIRVVMTLVVFGVVWVLLFALGSLFVDIDAVREELSESNWLKFLAPGVRSYLVSRGWQPLGALVVAVLAYRTFSNLSIITAERLFPIKPEFELSPGSKEVLGCFWKDTLIRKEEKIAEELGISVNRVREALQELRSHGLVRPRKRPKGLFWDKTGKGKKYLSEQ